MKLPDPQALLKELWAKRLTLLVCAIASALVAIPISLTQAPSFTSTSQILIPAKDPVAGNESRAGTSVVALRLVQYASLDLPGVVRTKLGNDASKLSSLKAVRERNPIFFRLTSVARTPTLAKKALDVAAVTLIEKANALAEDQLKALSNDALRRIEDLRKAEAPLRAQEIVKQAELDSLNGRVKDLENSLLQARDTVNRARIVGNFASIPAAQAVAAELQKEIDALNPKVEPIRTELDRIKVQLSVVTGQRESLEELLQSSTRGYVGSLVNSTVSEAPSTPGNARLQRAGQSAVLGAFAGLLLATINILASEKKVPRPRHSHRLRVRS